jgi:hypothetical protein
MTGVELGEIDAGLGCGWSEAICDQTSITLQSPHNAWPAGMYTLALNVDGKAGQCTLSVPDPPPTGTVKGTCSAMDTAWTLTQLCPQPETVCNDAGACGGFYSPSNCLAGQFQMYVVISPHESGANIASGVASQVAIDLSVDGMELDHETIAPAVKTTEPRGPGCGTCTNASATLSVAGG